MLTFTGFTGINNVLPEHRLKASELVSATDVDIGLTGDLSRRDGYSEVSGLCHKNLHQAEGFKLATVGSVLTAIWPNGDRHAIHPAVGPERVWFCNLPNGKTTFSNGLVHGMTDGLTLSLWSIPAPDSLGAASSVHGDLDAGDYRYHLSFARLSDGMEGPAVSSEPVALGLGGLFLVGLPSLAGHKLNVYLSGKDGEGAYLAGAATGGEFSFTRKNNALVLPCRTLGAMPLPVGTYTSFWRGRVLVAQGTTLWASMPGTTHLCQWRDFKQFPADIAMVQPVDDGVYVGTTQDLIFLAGPNWEQLSYVPTKRGAVVPGSGVSAPGDRIKMGDGSGNGTAMLCIAGGEVIAGFAGGQTVSLTGERYRTTATEVCATFRDVGGVPQYIAVPQ